MGGPIPNRVKQHNVAWFKSRSMASLSSCAEVKLPLRNSLTARMLNHTSI